MAFRLKNNANTFITVHLASGPLSLPAGHVSSRSFDEAEITEQVQRQIAANIVLKLDDKEPEDLMTQEPPRSAEKGRGGK